MKVLSQFSSFYFYSLCYTCKLAGVIVLIKRAKCTYTINLTYLDLDQRIVSKFYIFIFSSLKSNLYQWNVFVDVIFINILFIFSIRWEKILYLKKCFPPSCHIEIALYSKKTDNKLSPVFRICLNLLLLISSPNRWFG